MNYNNNCKDTLFGIRLDLLICLFLAMITLTVFWQVKYHEFISLDDYTYVIENRHIQSGLTPQNIYWSFTTMYATNWHPLTWLSHMMDVQIFGIKPGSHHLTNVFFHMVNALMLFLVLRRMTKGLWQSAFVAALFALHPLHVESVAWVAERKDVLSTSFWMMTLWGYVWYVERPGITRYLLTSFFFVLGLMSKPMLVTLPFTLLLLDYWPLKRFQLGLISAKRLVLEKIPLFLFSAASCVITYYAQQSGGAVVPFSHHHLNARIANALVSYSCYIGKMIWPFHLSAIYPYQQVLPWWLVAGSCLLLLSVSWLAIRALGRHPYLAVGWLWYMGTLVPVIGLIQVGGQAMADRYTYIPLIGLFIMIAWGVPWLMERWHKKKLVLTVMGATVLLFFTALTLIQLRYWKNSITLFEHAQAVTGSSFMVHNNLGFALLQLGRTDEAINNFSEALKKKPMSELVHNNLGLALAKQGKINEAISHYFEALRIKPDYELAHNNLGLALVTLGRTEEAVSHFYEALRIKPDYADAHNNLGTTLAKLGKTDEALNHFYEALRIKPDNAVAHSNLGSILAARGNTVEAISHYSEALIISPDYEEALNNLAWIYATNRNHKLRNSEKAVRLAEHVCEITGYKSPVILDTLAAAYAEAGLFEKARSTVQKAIKLAEAEGKGKVVEDFRKRLELYDSALPFYDDKP
jgi:protein O-mannosyl-transferase